MRRPFLTTAAAGLVVLLGPGALPAAAADDPLRPQQYALDVTGLSEAAALADGSGQVVAVVDSGVDLDHPDLQSRLVPGLDLIDGDDRPDDANGHGTHVAGIVAAATGNGVGVAGAAPGAQILPVRALGANGTGSPAVIADGVRQAVAAGATVVVLSLDDVGPADALRRNGVLSLTLRLVSGQAVVVAAAGNQAQVEAIFRAGVPALVVAATDRTGAAADFTNFGDPRSLAAPGVDVLSTAPTEPTPTFPEGTNGYATLTGTSMAAPLVAGAAAQLLSAGATPAQARELLLSTASPSDDPRLGAGTLDAAAAVAALKPTVATVTPLPSGSGAEPSAAPEQATDQTAVRDDGGVDDERRRRPGALAVLALLSALAAVGAWALHQRRRTSSTASRASGDLP